MTLTEITPPVVFISYSHDNEEHRNWVLQLATRLRSNGLDIILDRWNLKLGSDLASFMERGLSKSNRVVCVCSDIYITKANDGKGGTGYEKQIMTAELLTELNANWIIPLIKNNSSSKKTPTFLSGRMYISFENDNLYETKYEELLRELLDEPILPIPPIGKNPFQTIKEFAKQKFIPSSEKYVSPATNGKVTFDSSNNNGRYSIGQEELMFETCWSGASSASIHVYNDPSSIRSVALVKNTLEIKAIKDARIYDSSSRARTVNIGQIVVLQNNNGFYAAIKVVKIDNNELTFEYYIQTNGSPDFTT
jgi:TIR domain